MRGWVLLAVVCCPMLFMGHGGKLTFLCALCFALYAQVSLIVQIAQRAGVDAVWPGWCAFSLFSLCFVRCPVSHPLFCRALFLHVCMLR